MAATVSPATLPPATLPIVIGYQIVSARSDLGPLNGCFQEMSFHWQFAATTSGVHLDLTVSIPVANGGGTWEAWVILVGDQPVWFPALAVSFSGECVPSQ